MPRWASTNASTSTLGSLITPWARRRGHDQVRSPPPARPVPFEVMSVVTGDAVVLDVQIAQLPVRTLSALIDIAVMVIGYLLG